MGTLFLSMAMVACGNDEPNNGGNEKQPTEQDIRRYALGAWQMRHQKGYVDNGEYKDNDYNGQQILITETNVVGYSYRDGNWVKEMSGEYTLSGNKLKCRLYGEHGTQELTITVVECTATKIVLSANFSGKGDLTMTYRKIPAIDLESHPNDIAGETVEGPGTSSVIEAKVRQYLLNNTWILQKKEVWYEKGKQAEEVKKQKLAFETDQATLYRYDEQQQEWMRGETFKFTISGNEIFVREIGKVTVMNISENSVTLREYEHDKGQYCSDLTYKREV